MTQAPPSPDDTADLRLAVVSDALPERNGAGAYYPDLLAYLRPRLAAAELIGPTDQAVRKAIRVPMPGDRTQPLVFPAPRHLRRRLAAIQPHIVVVATPGPIGLMGLRVGRKLGATLIAGYHTHFAGLADLYWGRLRARAAQAGLRRANELICRTSQRVVVNNAGLVPTIRALGGHEVAVVGTPLAPPFLAPATAPTNGLRTVAFAGRLAAEKNIDAVLAAARSHPELTFRIAGDGPERASVQAAAAELPNLHDHGWLARQDLAALIDDADLLVLPSKAETFGSVALEAMGRARPVLVGGGAGIWDWPDLHPGLVAFHAGETVRDGLTRLAREDAQRWAQRGDAARAAAEGFNERTVAHWLALLRQAAGVAA